MERYHESWSKFNEKITILFVILFFILISMLFIPQINAANDVKNVIGDYNAKSSHILIEKESGRVLYGDNINVRLPMASTTKIMTCLVAIESGSIDKEITITKEMTNIEGSSIYLKVGEKLTIRELLYGLMLRSGNDSATAIAIGIGGDIQSFVDLMNKKVDELNLKNTHFVNPHGLHDKEHYTSAYDLAMISRCAMNNSVFREIVSSKTKIICKDAENKRYLVNKNKILNLYEGGNGIKTGYTKLAGRCLVSSAKRGNMELISVVLNEPDMWNYSCNNMDKGFENYVLLDIVIQNQNIKHIDINGKIFKICTHNTIKYPVLKSELKDMSYKIEIFDNIKNVKFGDNIGKLLVYNGKHLIFDEKIYTM